MTDRARRRWLGALLGAALAPGAALAQVRRPGPPPGFYTTYRYTAYTVYDHTTGDPPTRVAGIGGTLTLFPTGAYNKRLRITGPNGPLDFVQHGRCTVSGDSIRFAFADAKGYDVQRGTFRYDARTRHLIVAIAGYPPGSQGVYELSAYGRLPMGPAPRAQLAPGKRP